MCIRDRSLTDLYWVYGGGMLVLVLLVLLWRPLLAVTVDQELARAEGIEAARYELMLMLIIAAVIALAMKIVGVLLVTSMLIIPAAAARRLSRTPEQMALMAAFVWCTFGLVGSPCLLPVRYPVRTFHCPGIADAVPHWTNSKFQETLINFLSF